MAARVAEIGTLAGEDGVDFVAGSAAAVPIRDGPRYAGVRVTMDARIATASVKLRLDVNFGDPVTPARKGEIPSPRAVLKMRLIPY